MKPTRKRLFLLVVSGFLAAGSLLSAQEGKDTPAKAAPEKAAVDNFQFEKKKGDQESANELASELLKRILDIQLRQLRENGLEEEPYFAAIEKMRDNIDELLKKNMQGVVEILEGALGKDPEAQKEDFKKASLEVRKIVQTLYLEKHNLIARLKAAALAAEIRRLISHQGSVRDDTQDISTDAAADNDSRDAQQLSVIENQRGVHRLYLGLVGSLEAVSKLGGKLGAGAADGRRILKAAAIDEKFSDVRGKLEGDDFSSAAKSQTLIIKALQLLLRKIEETQGLIGTDLEAALKLLQELIKRQETVKDSTKTAKLDVEEELRGLVDEQSSIRRDLGQLVPVVQDLGDSAALLDEARASAYEATGNLFDELRDDAQKQQEDVLQNLANLEERLKAAIAQQDDKRSALELAKRVKDLRKVKATLQGVRKQQAAVEKTAPRDLPAASALEKKAVEGLAGIGEGKDLPPVVGSRLREASGALGEADQSLEEAAESAAAELPEETEEALEDASLALERASAEVEAALADAEREQKAVEIAELARSAEVLERAAAAEREISKQSKQASAEKGFTKAQAAKLLDNQKTTNEIVKNTSEALTEIAGEVSKNLAGLSPKLEKLAADLTKSEASPGEGSKETAAEVAPAASEIAAALSAAAQDLRREIGTCRAEYRSTRRGLGCARSCRAKPR